MTKNIKRNDILDKIGSVNREIKEEIIQNQRDTETSKTPIGRKVDNCKLEFEINDDDNEFVAFIKEEINNSDLTKEELYKIYDRSEAYNMIYTLKQGVLSLTRMKKWLDALGKELILKTRDIDK